MPSMLLNYSWRLLIPSVILLHLVVSPYTKVEESFNIQAIHDILIHGIPYENAAQKIKDTYDHIEFSGSVPRTFIGALVIAGITKPLSFFATNQEHLQVIGTRLFRVLYLSFCSLMYWSSKGCSGSSECSCIGLVPECGEPNLWHHDRILVYSLANQSIPCDVLCLSDITKYVRLGNE